MNGEQLQKAAMMAPIGAGGLSLHNAKLTERLDSQISILETHLANLKTAREVLRRNPDFEILSDLLRGV